MAKIILTEEQFNYIIKEVHGSIVNNAWLTMGDYIYRRAIQAREGGYKSFVVTSNEFAKYGCKIPEATQNNNVQEINVLFTAGGNYYMEYSSKIHQLNIDAKYMDGCMEDVEFYKNNFISNLMHEFTHGYNGMGAQGQEEKYQAIKRSAKWAEDDFGQLFNRALYLFTPTEMNARLSEFDTTLKTEGAMYKNPQEIVFYSSELQIIDMNDFVNALKNKEGGNYQKYLEALQRIKVDDNFGHCEDIVSTLVSYAREGKRAIFFKIPRNAFNIRNEQEYWVVYNNFTQQAINALENFKKRAYKIAYDYIANKNTMVSESITSQEITAEANETDRTPTEAQKKAGNYKMGHISVKGMRIAIENPKGSYRRGVDEKGKEWKTLMHNHYGYFNVTKGKDGDAVDCFIGPKIEDFDKVYCIDQNNKEGEFDETKVMLGFDSKKEAKAAYLSNYSPNWRGFRSITCVPLKTFKKWLYRGRKQRHPFSDYVEMRKKQINEQKILNEGRQGLSSKKLFDIISKYGYPHYGHGNIASFDLHSIKDKDVVGVFPYRELPKTMGEEIKWVKSMGYNFGPEDGIRNLELSSLGKDGDRLYAVIIVPNLNFDTTSVEKEGGFKDYVAKKDERERLHNNDGKGEYQWKSKDAENLMFRNPFYKDWSKDSKDNLRAKVKQDYLKEGKKIKNDKGEIVPEKCPDCGGDVKLYIEGEPVYLCSKCKKYFGTKP